jgi:hypothetical protein
MFETLLYLKVNWDDELQKITRARVQKLTPQWVKQRAGTSGDATDRAFDIAAEKEYVVVVDEEEQEDRITEEPEADVMEVVCWGAEDITDMLALFEGWDGNFGYSGEEDGVEGAEEEEDDEEEDDDEEDDDDDEDEEEDDDDDDARCGATNRSSAPSARASAGAAIVTTSAVTAPAKGAKFGGSARCGRPGAGRGCIAEFNRKRCARANDRKFQEIRGETQPSVNPRSQRAPYGCGRVLCRGK